MTQTTPQTVSEQTQRNTIQLRWILVAAFTAVLVVSLLFAFSSGAVSPPWVALGVFALVGLAWAAWGEPVVKPILPPYVAPPVAAPSVSAPTIEPIAGPKPSRWEENYVNHAQDAILRFDDQLTIAYANTAAENMFGYPSGEMVGVSVTALFPDGGARRAWQERVKERALRKDGASILVEMTTTRTSGSASEKAAVTLCLREFPDARRQAATDERNRRYETYFQWAPVPLIVFNRDGHVERMNRAAETVTEYAAAELRSQPYWEVFLTEGEAPDAEHDLHTLLLKREAAPICQTWRTRTGRALPYTWSRVILSDDFGQPAAVLAAAVPPAGNNGSVDMPVDMLGLADQLTTVSGYSELLLMSVGQDDPIRADLETIHRAGVAAGGHIRQTAA